MPYTRRDIGKLALTALPATLVELPWTALAQTRKPNSTIDGVRIGTITYSYRSMPDQSAEATLRYIVESGISQIELMNGPAESFAGAPQGGRGGGGGGRGGQNDSLLAKIGQAKNGLTAGMSPGEQTNTTYADVKAQAPKAIADLNAAIAKATTVAGSLTRYNLTLTVPQPVKAPDAAARRTTNSARQ